MNPIWKIKIIAAFALFVCLNGCALKPHLVTLFKLDTHQINYKDTNGDFRAERTMMAEALKYCDALDKRLLPIELIKSFHSNTYTLTFKCLEPDSPEFREQNKLDHMKENQQSSDFLSSLLIETSQS